MLDKAFLADILEHPDDDAPRLVYADWLQDNGDPDRAEFIRAQVDLARPRLPGGAARRKELQQRVKVLFHGHGTRWANAVGDWCSSYVDCWRRGFPAIASAGGSLTAVAARLPGILAAAPVSELCITLARIQAGEGAALAACEGLSRLKRLHFYASGATLDRGDGAAACEAELAALLRSPHLTGLARFEAIQVGVGESGLKALIDLPRLSELSLYATALRNADPVRLICRSPLAARLTELHLTDGSGPAHARAIARTPALNKLRLLDLEQTGVNDGAAKRLAESAHLAGLRELGLYGCSVGDAGTAAIARSPHFTKLRVLNLSRNAVGYAGVRALLASTTLPRGLDLDLWDNHSTDYTADLRAALHKRFAKVNFARSN